MKTHKTEETQDLEMDQPAGELSRLYALANGDHVPYRVFRRARKQAAIAVPEPATSHNDAPEATEQPVAEPQPKGIAEELPVAASPAEIEPPPVEEPPAVSRVVPEVFHPVLFEPERKVPAPAVPAAVAVASLVGGAGKTTLVANLGRALSHAGELVLLADVAGGGLLPFYFGAAELRPGLRTFWAPGVPDTPICVIGSEDATPDWIRNDVRTAMRSSQRTIFDLGACPAETMPEVLGMCAVLLVPVLADLNSIVSIARMESMVEGLRARGIAAPLPFYLSCKFDEQSAMEREGRAAIRRQVGDRLLPMTIRRSVCVTEATALRMTVADHAPESEVARDFQALAQWLMQAAPVSPLANGSGRWSER